MKELQFRTNSRHIGQLGRELVTDFVTALVELVKNSYDADAGSVRIIIEQANTPQSRIIIVDTGYGMTQTEFENKWMVIGTSNKVSEPYTPMGRKKAGKKGIGRFSVERLAERATIYSYTDRESYKVFINWNRYEEISVEALSQRIRILRENNDVAAAKFVVNQIEYYFSLPDIEASEREFVKRNVGEIIDNYELLFDDRMLDVIEFLILDILKKYEKLEQNIESVKIPLQDFEDYEQEDTYRLLSDLREAETKKIGKKATGMVLVLDRLRDSWRQKDIDKLQKELRLLVAPDFIEKEPFHIELKAEQFKVIEELSVNDILDLCYAKVTAKIFDSGRKSEISYWDKGGITREKKENYESPLLCGDLGFTLYYFLRDSMHLKNENNNYRFAVKVLDQYCGIKIYRDSFRVKPYGDIGNDWLELDKDKVKDTHGYRVGNNQTIGVIQISDIQNPLLIDATNREGIIENQAYEQMKAFILKCVMLVSEIRAEEGRKSRSDLEIQLEKTEKLKKKNRTYKKDADKKYQLLVELIDKGADKSAIKSVLAERKRDEEEYHQEKDSQYEKTEQAYRKVLDNQETELSMYKNLASLGILTGNFGHETQDIVSRIGECIVFYEMLSRQVQNQHFSKVTGILKDDFLRIAGYSEMIVEFLRRHKRRKNDNLDLGMVLDGICKLYNGMLKEFGITLRWEFESDITFSMRQIDTESIIINLITNAFEQVKGKAKREIFLKIYQEEEDIYLICEDSGNGVPVDRRKEIFRPFVTTKEDGIGLGLNIVGDIVEKYNGTVDIGDSESLGGAKFCMHFVKKEEI